MTERFVVGFIRGPHGLSGMFKVASASGEYGHLIGLREVTLRKGGSERHCVVEKASEGAGVLFLKCAGINSPEDAKKYSGWELVAPRRDACPLKKDEYYIEDLKGCSLIYGDSKEGSAAGSVPAAVGIVTDVLEGGAGDLLEVLLSESRVLADAGIDYAQKEKPRTVLIPFKKEFIGAVDTVGRTIRLMHLWILE